MKIKTALVVMALAQISSAQSRSRSAAEQVHFSAEDAQVRSPVVLAKGALAVIRRDPDVEKMLKNQDVPLTELPESWLMASEVHLTGPEEKDIVVVGAGPLAAANVTTFWLLRPKSNGFDLLMTAPAHDLIIKNSRSKGYRDIEILAATAVGISTVSLRFDGNRYELYNQNVRDIR